MSDIWNEGDSDVYRQLARIAVPSRHQQIAALLTLIPRPQNGVFTAVELGCGQGLLAAAFLRCFPNARLVALDGSDSMRIATAGRVGAYRDRVEIQPFDLAAPDWWPQMDGAVCVLSSLVVHHLDANGKQRLFAEAAHRLSAGGALLLADLVEPGRPEARELFGATWDESTERQAHAAGAEPALDTFYRERWNYYRFPDSVDHPSGLGDQILWLRAAGFAYADAFWLYAGHAVYGGYLPTIAKGTLSYPQALAFVSE